MMSVEGMNAKAVSLLQCGAYDRAINMLEMALNCLDVKVKDSRESNFMENEHVSAIGRNLEEEVHESPATPKQLYIAASWIRNSLEEKRRTTDIMEMNFEMDVDLLPEENVRSIPIGTRLDIHHAMYSTARWQPFHFFPRAFITVLSPYEMERSWHEKNYFRDFVVMIYNLGLANHVQGFADGNQGGKLQRAVQYYVHGMSLMLSYSWRFLDSEDFLLLLAMAGNAAQINFHLQNHSAVKASYLFLQELMIVSRQGALLTRAEFDFFFDFLYQQDDQPSWLAPAA